MKDNLDIVKLWKEFQRQQTDAVLDIIKIWYDVQHKQTKYHKNKKNIIIKGVK